MPDLTLSPMIIIGVGALIILAMGALAFAGPSTAKAQSRRLTAVKDRHSGSANLAEVQMRKIIANRVSSFDASFIAKMLPNTEQLNKRLMRTGKNWTAAKYWLSSLGIGVTVSLLLLIKSAPWALIGLGGLLLGLLVPHLVVGFLIKKRIKQFNQRFPDGIELMVRGLRSGLPISETMNVVATEIPGPCGEEFRMVVDGVKIGRTLDEALIIASTRMDTPEFKFFTITLAIQRETGGNLAETLSNLADVLRKRAQMKLKIKAMSSEAKASAYIVGCLPFVVFGMVWMVNQKYLSVFFTDERLIVAGLGGLFWMSMGGAIMAKMVNFEI